MQLKANIGAFFVEFSKFETSAVGAALRALSKDAVFVEQAARLLDLEARLKLLERMAFAKGVGASLMAEIDAALARARRLSTERDEVARAWAIGDVGLKAPLASLKESKSRGADYARLAQMSDLMTPTAAQIQAYTAEAIELQYALRGLSERIDQQLLAADPAAQAVG